MEPSELYNKNKRTLVVFAAILALLLLGGVKPEDQGQILGFRISSPQLVPTTFVAIVIYCLYNYIFSWFMQSDSVRSRIKYDFWINTSIGILVPLSYFILVAAPMIDGMDSSTLLLIPLAIITAVAAAIAVYQKVEGVKWRKEAFSLRKDTIAERLEKSGWVLVFNSRHPKGYKPIEFMKDGFIGEGQNNNEYSWTLDGDTLVIYQKDGSLQNKFDYDEETNQFVSTNDPTAAAIQRGTLDQYIYRQ